MTAKEIAEKYSDTDKWDECESEQGFIRGLSKDIEALMKQRAKEVWDEAVDLYSYADEETDWHFEEYYKQTYGK